MSAMKAKRAFWPAAPLVADERLRLVPRAVATSMPRRELVVALGVILLLHASLIAFILYRDRSERVEIQPEQEIPVEVVAEVPPDPPKPPQPDQQKPEENYDKPAYSAPRAATEMAAAEQEGAQQKTEAPQAQSKAQEGAPVPANTTVPAPQVTASALRGRAEEKIADDKAEAFEPASPSPDTSPGQAQASAKAENSAADLLRQLSAQPSLSSFSFAATTRLAPLTGGSEDNRFMSNVFAKIMSKKRYPKSAVARRASGTVMVSFIIDGEGGLVYQTVSHSSGEADLDAEAMAAVKSAAPYPPPPPGAPRSLLATIKF
jgi:TonB family protein